MPASGYLRAYLGDHRTWQQEGRVDGRMRRYAPASRTGARGLGFSRSPADRAQAAADGVDSAGSSTSEGFISPRPTASASSAFAQSTPSPQARPFPFEGWLLIRRMTQSLGLMP